MHGMVRESPSSWYPGETHAYLLCLLLEAPVPVPLPRDRSRTHRCALALLLRTHFKNFELVVLRRKRAPFVSTDREPTVYGLRPTVVRDMRAIITRRTTG